MGAVQSLANLGMLVIRVDSSQMSATDSPITDSRFSLVDRCVLYAVRRRNPLSIADRWVLNFVFVCIAGYVVCEGVREGFGARVEAIRCDAMRCGLTKGLEATAWSRKAGEGNAMQCDAMQCNGRLPIACRPRSKCNECRDAGCRAGGLASGRLDSSFD